MDGSDFIDKVVMRLKTEGVLLYDANIVRYIRGLSTHELKVLLKEQSNKRINAK